MILTPAHDGPVVCADGDGASRHSLRNRTLVGTLDRAGLATRLVDLLGEGERPRRGDSDREVELLAHRLAEVTRWAISEPEIRELPLAYLGASAGG